MRAVSEDEVLELIDRIYEAGMSFERWPDALTRMADLLGARDASLGTVAADALPWIFAPRTDPELMRVYAEAYHPLNPVWRGVARRGVGQATSDSMVMPRDELVKTAFYNEWSWPQGYSTAMGSIVLAEHGWRTVVMLPGRDAFGRDELALLQMLTPHLRRAVQMNIRLAQGDLNSGVTVRALEELKVAAFLVDADARVLFANAAAEALFRDGQAARKVQGVLTAARAEDAATLREMVDRCALVGPDETGGVVAICQNGDAPVRLQFLPVRRETPLLAPGLPVAIVFEASREAPADPAARLRREYGLTATEAAFALEIAKGDGKPAAAERLGVSYATARTHLTHIFEKTGVHRQAELVRLILREGGDEA